MNFKIDVLKWFNRSKYNKVTKDEQINELLEDLQKDLAVMKLTVEKK